MHTSNIVMVSINLLFTLKSLTCYVKKKALLLYISFRLCDTTSEQLDLTTKPVIFRVTSNANCFAWWLSNPYAHWLAFISSIRVSCGPCGLRLPMSIFLYITFPIFLGRHLFLVTVNFLLLMLLGSIFDCRCSGSRIIKDSGLCLVPSFGSGISNPCSTAQVL